MGHERLRMTTSASQDKATFVTFSHPSQFKSRTTRHVVRSYVTKRQHQAARLKIAQSAERSRETTAQTLDGMGMSLGIQINKPCKGPGGRSVPGTSPDIRVALGKRDKETKIAWDLTSQSCTKNITSENLAPVEQLQHHIGDDYLQQLMRTNHTNDPLSMVENFMLANFTPMGWSALNLSEVEASEAEECLRRLSQKEPALWHARLLLAASYLAQVEIVNQELCEMLSQQTITSIFEALADDNRKDSEGLILATSHLAFHECMFGTRQVAHMHRAAQRRMIELKGGINSLAVPIVIKYAVEWADTIVSLHECEAFPTESSVFERERCNSWVSLKALSQWFPKQFASLATEISSITSIPL